jgi:hypothetical protein
MKPFFRRPIDDVVACLEPIVTVRNPLRALGPLLLSLVATWVLYVPIHELLHAYACSWTGGTVTQLEISPHYGGAIYARYFPFVVSGGEYAGRLSGFDTKGSDLIYLATDFGPYLLTVLIGVPLLKLAGRRRRPILFGAAVVLGLAPFYSLPGDYFEIGSITTTRLITLFRGGGVFATKAGAQTPLFEKLRSDDIFKLIEQLCTQPSELGLQGAGGVAAAVPIILVSLVFALGFAFATYAVGHYFAALFLTPSRSPAR